MTAPTIPALRALLAAATPGTWFAAVGAYVHGADDEADPIVDAAKQGDAELIAAAVNALPTLLDRLDLARELIQDLPCYVARNGEGTYECRIEALCPACAARERMGAK